MVIFVAIDRPLWLSYRRKRRCSSGVSDYGRGTRSAGWPLRNLSLGNRAPSFESLSKGEEKTYDHVIDNPIHDFSSQICIQRT